MAAGMSHVKTKQFNLQIFVMSTIHLTQYVLINSHSEPSTHTKVNEMFVDIWLRLTFKAEILSKARDRKSIPRI